MLMIMYFISIKSSLDTERLTTDLDYSCRNRSRASRKHQGIFVMRVWWQLFYFWSLISSWTPLVCLGSGTREATVYVSWPSSDKPTEERLRARRLFWVGRALARDSRYIANPWGLYDFLMFYKNCPYKGKLPVEINTQVKAHFCLRSQGGDALGFSESWPPFQSCRIFTEQMVFDPGAHIPTCADGLQETTERFQIHWAFLQNTETTVHLIQSTAQTETWHAGLHHKPESQNSNFSSQERGYMSRIVRTVRVVNY